MIPTISGPAERLRRAFAMLALGAGALLMTGGLVKVAPTTAQQKLIAQHYTNNDPIWGVLTSAVVSEDRAKGQLDAVFPPAVAALKGTTVTVSGFMTPLEAQPRVRHFILTRRSTVCPFCPPNAPSEAVEVRLDTPVPVTAEELTVAGRLDLVSASDEGLFYALAAAKPARRTGG